MDLSVFIFLTSGLFLGWALGANHLGNIFGTAIGTRMIRFNTAAVICSIFVILGAVISGGGTSETVGKLGSVNALGGAFMAAFAAAVAVYVMTRFGLPVSTTHAIVGGILGWNVFSGTSTDYDTLIKIMIGWVLGPILAAGFAMLLLVAVVNILKVWKVHILSLDAYVRFGLVVAGAFGAFSLGANNIANVVGVFIPASPFTEFRVADLLSVSASEQLFLIGGVAIAVGVFTYSGNVVHTVGKGLFTLSPIAAWVVVVAHSLVLFMFASQGLEALLERLGLPTIPLVPISSSEVVVGAVIGVALLKGAHNIRWRVLGRIGVGWALTPIIAGIICYVGLFFLQNVFGQEVYRPLKYTLTPEAIARLNASGLATEGLSDLTGQTISRGDRFLRAVRQRIPLTDAQEQQLLHYAESGRYEITGAILGKLNEGWIAREQMTALRSLSGMAFAHRWQIAEALAARTEEWRPLPPLPANKLRNRDLAEKLEFVYRTFGQE
ncbi:MAG: inorganic phosphate transporter [Rhodospirillales bacterium]|nr:inorganic phosphate transporter [Rhodospirillales bacterium]